MNELQREYACPDCLYMYWGYWTPEKGREPCPNCGGEPYACDTFSFAYWAYDPANKGKHYWWTRDRAPQHAIEYYEKQSMREVPVT